MKKTLTIQLTKTKFDDDRETLGELLEQVSNIIYPTHSGDDPTKNRSGKWVATWAIRAMCEEIIRTGHMWCPPEVSFTHFWCKRAKGFRFQASRN